MNLYLHRIPQFFHWIYPNIIWRIPSSSKTIYLTFDDGPSPYITHFVLKELSKHQAKATFFCLGKNIEQHPETFKNIVEQNHTIGNHSYSHLNGWTSDKQTYSEDINKCEKLISPSKKLFRPPYGRIKKNQINLLKSDYKIILWNYMVGDFDKRLSKEKCWERAKSNIKNGDIVVFHDNEKSFETLQYVLPRVLNHFTDKGYIFKSL